MVFDVVDNAAYSVLAEGLVGWVRAHPAIKVATGGTIGAASSTFSIDRAFEHGLIAQAARTDDDALVAIRLQHRADADPMRSWRTEASLERTDRASRLALRIAYVGPEGEIPTFRVPRFIRHFIEAGLLADVFAISDKAWAISEDDAPKLSELIGSADRRLPVIVLSDGAVVDVAAWARDFTGIAHVVSLENRSVASAVATSIGQHLNPGAIATIYPVHDMEKPRFRVGNMYSLVQWEYDNVVGTTAFARYLYRELRRLSITRLYNDPAQRSYEEARSRELAQERAVVSKVGSTDLQVLERELQEAREDRDLQTAQVEVLRAELLTASDLLDETSNETADLRQQLDEAREERFISEQRANALAQALAVRAYVEARQDDTPDSLEELAAWAARNYPTRLTVTTNAVKRALKSGFRDAGFVFRALTMLATDYHALKHGDREAVRRYDEECGVLGLEDRPCHRNGEPPRRERDRFMAQLPAGRTIYVNRHLCGTSIRDPEYQFRLYFAFDEVSDTVVVHHLTDHIRDSNT